MFQHLPINHGVFIDHVFNTCSFVFDSYATRQMYGYCPQWALSWEYRKKGILDEVRHYGADIISLQVSHDTVHIDCEDHIQ